MALEPALRLDVDPVGECATVGVRARSKSVVASAGRLVIAVLTLVVAASPAAGQSNVYVGGAFTPATQTHDATELGGTGPGGSILVGARVSPRVAAEFDVFFSRRYSSAYSYAPFIDATADVIPSRRDTTFSFLVRVHAGVLEPVVGAGVVHGALSRHATIAGRPYFDEAGSDNAVAVVGGLDASERIAPHLYIVPTFRVVVIPAWNLSGFDPLRSQTATGRFVFRYGVGARVTF